MKVRNVVLVAVALLVLAAGGAFWWLYASRDALIKRAIERFGPELTGVSVSVASVKLEPLDGRGAIKGLEIGNPRGYKAPHALELGEVRLAVEPASLASDVVHVSEISLEAPAITSRGNDKRDLGKKTGGATAAQITEEVWTTLTRQAIASAPASIRGLEERAKGAVDRLKGLFK